MSINKTQAAALADNFLDDIGSAKGEEFQPRETYTQAILLAGELIESAQDNLNKSNSNASGRLSSSLEASEPQESGNVLQIDITMNEYGQYLNKGVKGTKSGTGLYQFKYDTPSKKMVDALKENINRAKKSSANVNRKKTISANEKKNVSISDLDKAYAVGRSIKMYGIKPTGFMDKAIDETSRKVADRLGDALVVDIINTLNAIP